MKDVKDKLDVMNGQVESVLKKKEEQIKEKKHIEQLKIMQKEYEIQKVREMQEKDNQKLIEKMKREEERIQKMKQEKEEYKKFYNSL